MLLGAAQLAVGAAAIFARFALSGAPPLSVSAARLTIASIVLLAIGLLHSPKSLRVSARHAALLGVAGLALAVHFATWIASLQYTSVAISTLLVATTPIWTATYDAVVFHRPLTRLALAAFVTGAVGVYAVVGFNRTIAPIPGHEVGGALLALAGGAAIAAYFILVREVRADLGTRTIVTHTYSWAAIALIVVAAAFRQPLPPLTNTVAWGGIAGMALVSQLLGHTAMNASLRWFTPSAVAFSTLLEPVVAAVLALLIFGEAVGPVAVAGALLLLASIGVVLKEEPMAA
ncbi:MAG TPA: EamA family transporter [Candidatus Baltobacteraceae bacterium]|nr:EamA family transporter [Candidatus Baltobacteraceae bacterium]